VDVGARPAKSEACDRRNAVQLDRGDDRRIVGERRVVGTARSSRNERERPGARRDRRQPPPTGVMNRNQNRLTVGGEARPIERSRLASRRERSHGTGTDVDEHQIAADRKSTRLNSSHGSISYAVFCLKKKNKLEKEAQKNEHTL